MVASCPRADLLITNASEVLTCAPSAGDPTGRIPDGAVAVAGERILAVGETRAVLGQVDASTARVIDASGMVVAPGFVDSHTHLVFGGSRVKEYAARLTVDDPEMLKAMGIKTGILATVEMTRAAATEELISSALPRLGQMLRHGITTVEIKSGYGLTTAEEVRMLEVNRTLSRLQPVEIVSTFLGAHAFPAELPSARYVAILTSEMIPRVAGDGLAEFCDVYCDTGYFSADESAQILETAKRWGLKPKIHADAYASIGGSELAAEVGAVSADHLNYTAAPAIERLAAAGVVGVLMPGLDFAVRHQKPADARAMLAAGVTIALATDLCPASWIESMPWVLVLACQRYRLSPAEAVRAATLGGARALARGDSLGSLEPGKVADIQAWGVPSLEDLVYRLGANPVELVIKRGRVVVDRRETGTRDVPGSAPAS